MFDAEYEEYRKKHPPFDPVVDALLDEQTPFPPVFLARFSDLEDGDLAKLSRIWKQVSLARRQALLEDLESLNDTDTLVSFIGVGRMAIEDSDPHVRKLAIRLLWEDEDPRLANKFMYLMATDPDIEVRATAANALGMYVYEGEVEEIPEDLLHEVEEALLAAHDELQPNLLRRRALESLGFSSRPEVPGLIEEAYRRATPEWVATALFAMGRSAEQRWQSHILDMLGNENEQIRLEAVRAAGELELGRARERLLNMIRDEEDSDVRLAAAWSLSQIAGEGVREVLEEMAEDVDDDEEAALIEEALENLSFTEEVSQFNLLDFDEDVVGDLDFDDEDDESPSAKPGGKNSGKKKKGK